MIFSIHTFARKIKKLLVEIMYLILCLLRMKFQDPQFEKIKTSTKVAIEIFWISSYKFYSDYFNLC